MLNAATVNMTLSSAVQGAGKPSTEVFMALAYSTISSGRFLCLQAQLQVTVISKQKTSQKKFNRIMTHIATYSNLQQPPGPIVLDSVRGYYCLAQF